MPQFKWMDYVNAFDAGQSFSRKVMAEHFGVSPSTARYHLDRAVGAGRLNRQYGSVGIQSGWLYALPETMLRLDGV